MAPVIGFVRIGVHSIADRYINIPMAGLLISVVWATADLLAGRRSGTSVATVLTLGLLPLLGMATWKQTSHWKNTGTLFEQALLVTSDNWVAHNSLAADMIRQGKYQLGLWHAQEAVRINPSYTYAYINIGCALSALGDIRGAIGAYRDALLHDPQQRFIPEVYYKLGMAYSYAGDMKRAFETCHNLQQIDPVMADSLSRFLLVTGQMQEHPAAGKDLGK
jgi:tetratricopeptide (TPR) repeat protein